MIYIMSNALGAYLRKCRTEKQRREGNTFSLRQLAGRIHVEPSYLSKIERGLELRPSEETTRALALELGEDPDLLPVIPDHPHLRHADAIVDARLILSKRADG